MPILRRQTSIERIAITLAVLLLGIGVIFPLSAEEPVSKLKIVTDQANVRLKPDIGSIIIYQIPIGTIVDSLGKEGEWFRIQFQSEEGDTVTGYVHESLVFLLESPTRKREPREISPQMPEEKEKKESPREPAPKYAKIKAPRPSPEQSLIFHPEVSISGGGNLLSGGDINSGAQGLADFYGDIFSSQGKVSITPLHLSTIIGVELNFPVSGNLSLGVGADYLSGNKESVVDFQDIPGTFTFITRPKLQALPIRLVVSYRPVPFFYAKAGIEYSFAKCSYFYRFQKENFWQEWQGDASAQGKGIFGGFGFLQHINSRLSVFVEATGRYSKITGFKGTDNYSESTGISSTEEGWLYIYQGKVTEQKSYPLLFVREKTPSESGVFNPQKATVDFSGLTLRGGFKIRF